MKQVQRRTHRIRGVYALLIAVSVCGCSPQRYDVSGRVGYEDGQPFTGGGLVVLEGTVNGKAVMARGAIGSDGRFTVSFGRPGQGMLAGSYRVRLIPAQTPDVDAPVAQLPYEQKFLDCNTSGITFEVGGDTANLVILLGPRS